MAVERKFVQTGVQRARVEYYLRKELKRAGYGGMDMVRTPLGTQLTIFAEKPGMVIGKGGRVVRQITSDLTTEFDIESPQVEVQQVKDPNLNAQIMAERLANALERGWYFRKAGLSTLRRVMESGALGCEVVLSGKLTGSRGRVQKFVEGYIKHCGEPSETLVEVGYAVAIKKLGTIGVQVRLIPPGVKLPDDFEVLEPEPVPEEEIMPPQAELIGEEVEEEISEVVEEAEEEIDLEDLDEEYIEEDV